MASQESFVKEGNLEKKSRFLGIWRKRWTVLAPNDHDAHHRLTTHKKEKVYDNPTEVIRVDRKTNAGPTHNVKGAEHRAFIVQNTNGRSTERFLFRASSREERDEWLQSIKQLQGSRSTTAASSNGSHRASRHPTKSFVDSGDSKVMEEPVDSEQSQTVLSAASSSKQRDDAPPNTNVTANGATDHQSPDGAAVSPLNQNNENLQNQTVTANSKMTKSEIANSTEETEEEQEPTRSVMTPVTNGEEEEEEELVVDLDSANTDTALPTTSPFGVVSFVDDRVQNNAMSEVSEPQMDQNKGTEPSSPITSKEQTVKTEDVALVMDTTDCSNPMDTAKDGDDEERKENTDQLQATGVETEDDLNSKGTSGDEQRRANEPKKESQETVDIDGDLNESQKQMEETQETTSEMELDSKPEPESEQKPEPEPVSEPEPQPEPEQAVEGDNDDDVKDSLNDDNAQNTDRNELNQSIKEEQTECNIVITADTADVVEESINVLSPLNAEEAEDYDEADDNVGDIVDVHNLKAMRTGAMITTTPMTDDDKESSVSSFRSDGDGPFGDRWGDWNETEEDTKEPTPAMTPVTNERTPAASTLKKEEEETVDQNVEETKEEEEEDMVPPDTLDTSGLKCGNIVVIGGESSKKSLLLRTLLGDSKRDKVITNDSGDSVLCSFQDTPCDAASHWQSTISAIATSDMALIAVSIKEDQLDSLRDTMIVLNTFGVERCVCCLSGIDTLNYEEERYQNVRDKMSKMMKKIGIKLKKVAFIPIDIGNECDNIMTAATESMKWYDGWTLKLKKEERRGRTVVEALHAMISHFAHKKGEKLPMVLPVSKVTDDGVICGKIEQGVISLNDQMVMALGNEHHENVSVDTMYRSQCVMECCKMGDYVSMSVSEMKSTPKIGDVLYLKNEEFELKAVSRITALVVMLSSTRCEVGSFEGMICIRSNAVQCELTKIHWKTSGKDGKVHDAQSLKEKEQGEVELTLKEPMVISTFEQCESLGRFVILHEDRPVMQGKVQSVDVGTEHEDDDGDDYY